MKKISLLICIILLLNFNTFSSVKAENDLGELTPSSVFEQINSDMNALYDKKNYFPSSIKIDGKDTPYRQDVIQKRIQDTDNKKIKLFEIVYGKGHGGEIKGIPRYLGYTNLGDDAPSEGFPWDAGWSGMKIQDFNLVPNPWKDERVKKLYKIKSNDFNHFNLNNPKLPLTNENRQKLQKYLEDGTFETAIQTGLNDKYAGVQYSKYMHIYNERLKTKEIYDRDAKPNTGKWVDYVHILQPPTEISWGYGRIFIEDDDNPERITYMSIYIAPFQLIEKQADLDVKFEILPDMKAAGQEVDVTVKVKSTFKKKIHSNYYWEISDSAGKPLSGLKFEGDAEAKLGVLTFSPDEKEKLLHTSFTMPDSDVRIKFSINEEGKEPVEEYLVNNTIQSQPNAIRLIEPPVPQRFPYHVLSMKKNFPLNNGNPIVAKLSLPDLSQAEWTGNATGAVTVKRNGVLDKNNKGVKSDLLQNFSVTGHEVDESNEEITKYPIINTTIYRTDFGDDPVKKNWLLPWSDYSKPKSLIAEMGYGGSVSRPYKFKYCDYRKVERDGKEVDECVERTGYGTATANFIPGTDQEQFDMYIYHGKQEIKKPNFENKIDHNYNTSKNIKLLWENEPYEYDVIRWMSHQNLDGKDERWEAVDGKYKRHFTQQASADIQWTLDSTMEQEYKKARDAARKGENIKASYDKAVFATDHELRRHAYPIKSGYYFNPAGRYTFTVETVTYKETQKDTQDHKDLVQALIDSFRYESDLMYITNDKNRYAVNIKGEKLDPDERNRGGFVKKTGTLTAINNKGVNGLELLTVLNRDEEPKRFTKNVEKINHEQVDRIKNIADPKNPNTETNGTHQYWKMTMEGYKQSGTEDSYNNYNYREFVKGKEMYKITEKSEITFIINQNNLDVYTHANMPNGEYTIKVWMEDIDLGDKKQHAYSKIEKPLLKGIESLDQITVNVTGSMYDDLNN